MRSLFIQQLNKTQKHKRHAFSKFPYKQQTATHCQWLDQKWWIGTISYKTFVETENSCCVPRFSLSVALVATKLLATKLHSPMLRSRSRKFWKGRSWSQTFHIRLRNLGCHTLMMVSISLVMVVQSNFCTRDFLTDHKFSMGLWSGEFPGQSITFNFASWKSFSLFQMKDTGQYLIGISFHHQEMPFSYLEWLFSQLHQCICINSSYPQLA